VSDESLRDLERRVAENPHDFAAGHELVRALERTGQRTRAERALARLARAGDALARGQVAHAKAPRSSVHEVGSRSGLRSIASARVLPALPPIGEGARPVAATDEVVVFTSGNLRSSAARTVGVDLVTASARWLSPGVFRLVAGRDAFFVLDETGLSALDRNGARREIRRFEENALHQVHDGRRAFLVFGGPVQSRLVAIDTGSGAELWSCETQVHGTDVRACGGRLFLHRPTPDGEARLSAHDAETGDELWARSVPRADLLVGPALVVVVSESRLHAFDGDTGTTVHEIPKAPGRGHLDMTRLVALDIDRLELLDLETPERGWSAHLGETAELRDAAIVGDHVWLAQVFREGRRRIELEAFDVASGARLRHVAHDCPEGSNYDTMRFIPLDGAVVLAIGGDTGLALLLRVEG
jgi:hypothetical protein